MILGNNAQVSFLMEVYIMDAAKEAVLEKLAKLMTLGKAEAHTPEGQSAMRMAAKLMAKHCIQESEIDLKEGNVNGQTIFEDEDGWEGLNDQGGKRQWVASLAAAIGGTFGGRCWINPGKGTIHFLATASDLETCLYFMDIVYSHIEREERKECRKPEQWRERNIFGQAAFEEVSIRLWEMKREMDKAVSTYSGGTDLMVIKNDLVTTTVDELFKERGFGASKSNWIKSSNKNLIQKGRIAGKNAPLNRAVEQ